MRHIHCQIAASEFTTDFDSWDMLTIIGSRSPYMYFNVFKRQNDDTPSNAITDVIFDHFLVVNDVSQRALSKL